MLCRDSAKIVGEGEERSRDEGMKELKEFGFDLSQNS